MNLLKRALLKVPIASHRLPLYCSYRVRPIPPLFELTGRPDPSCPPPADTYKRDFDLHMLQSTWKCQHQLQNSPRRVSRLGIKPKETHHRQPSPRSAKTSSPSTTPP